MACPTCDHTMYGVLRNENKQVYWCPRCGTLRVETGSNYFIDDSEPKLVGRCRRYAETFRHRGEEMPDEWRVFGIAESLNRPEVR